MSRVAFRCDAGGTIGAGHLMRCLVLAGSLREAGHHCLFLCGPLPAELRDLVLDRGHGLHELPQSCDAAMAWDEDAAAVCDSLREAGPWDRVVVDHYRLDARWESLLRDTTRAAIMAIDDVADRPHDCDLLLDQNLYADMPARYAELLPARCTTLFGPGYALLDGQFRQWRGRGKGGAGPLRQLLVSFGGSDPPNMTCAALRAIRASGLPLTRVDVALGGGNPHRPEVERLCADMPGVELHVQTGRMAELLCRADLVIGAGGVSAWERCCVGVPSLAFAIAENQRGQLREMARNGLTCAPEPGDDVVASICLHLRALAANPDLRVALAARSMACVDGLGAARVAGQLMPVEA